MLVKTKRGRAFRIPWSFVPGAKWPTVEGVSGKSWANVGICTDRAHGVVVWLDADYGPNLAPQRAQTVLKSPVTTVKEIFRRPPLKSSHEIITVAVPTTDLDVADANLCCTASSLTGSIDSASSVRSVDRAATCAWLCGGGAWSVRHQTAELTKYRSTVMAAQRAFASQADSLGMVDGRQSTTECH